MGYKGKSVVDERTYRAIYRLLDRVSPLDYNCGKLCGAACCGKPCDWYNPEAASDTAEEKDYGLYLFPGEEAIHIKEGVRDEVNYSWDVQQASDYDFPENWEGDIYFLSCRGPEHCSRKARPIQCRTFPLTPHLDENGELTLIYEDADVPYACPLIDDEIPLNDDFVQATFTVWKHLIRDRRIYDLVKSDSELR